MSLYLYDSNGDENRSSSGLQCSKESRFFQGGQIKRFLLKLGYSVGGKDIIHLLWGNFVRINVSKIRLGPCSWLRNTGHPYR